MPLTPEGWTLLKTWEGRRLSAYPDPASVGAPWTIGYGHTGAEVVPGLTITQDQAQAAGSVDRPLSGVALTTHQREALISAQAAAGRGITRGGAHPGATPLVQGAQWRSGRTRAP